MPTPPQFFLLLWLASPSPLAFGCVPTGCLALTMARKCPEVDAELCSHAAHINRGRQQMCRERTDPINVTGREDLENMGWGLCAGLSRP